MKDMINYLITVIMVLLPAGLLIGKAMADTVRRPTAGYQVARTSAMVVNNYSNPRRRQISTVNNGRKTTNPFSREELLSRAGGRSVRRESTQTREEEEKENLEEILVNEKWTAIYRYPSVRYAVLLARAKMVQTIASVAYLPYSTYNYFCGTADSVWFWSTASLAIAAPLLLIIFSRYLNRLIGVIAMNETNDFVRIGYLSFWGRRKDKYLEVNDILPLTEVGASTKDSLVKLTWFSSSSEYLFLPTRNAEIVNAEKAEILFGDLKMFDSEKKNQ